MKPSLLGLEPYRPGARMADLAAEHGLDRIEKLNWNEDLFGPLPGALQAVEAELEKAWMYPEQAYDHLRESVAEWLDVPPEWIVPAHGVQALVVLVAHVFLREGERVVVPRPTYGLYAQVSAAAGAEVLRVPLRDHRLDLEAAAASARAHHAKLVWVCDPNNPTGALVTGPEWQRFLAELPDGAVAVVDEAYAEYVDPALRISREADVRAGRPILLLRTFSKIFGLAGLRLGYAVCDPQLAAFLDVVQEPFNVNRAALAAGRACLARADLVEHRRRETAEARSLLARLLEDGGMRPLPSQANFVFVDLGVDDVALGEALVRRGFLIRPGSEFGLPGTARITVGPKPLMARVAAALVEEREALLARPALA